MVGSSRSVAYEISSRVQRKIVLRKEESRAWLTERGLKDATISQKAIES